MKNLISIEEIKEFYKAGEKDLHICKGTLVTDAARDYARDRGIAIVEDSQVVDGQPECKGQSLVSSSINKSVIAEIVQQVLASRGQSASSGYTAVRDTSGLKLVRGHSVTYEAFDTGKPTTCVKYREVISKDESSVSAGFLTIDHSSFTWTLTGYEETDIVLEGSLSITINGKTYYANQGDVLHIPKDSTVIWDAVDHVKLFYTTYPADWAD